MPWLLALTLSTTVAQASPLGGCKQGEKSACFQALRQIDNGQASAAERTTILDQLCKLQDAPSCQGLLDYYRGAGGNPDKAHLYESRLRNLGVVPSLSNSSSAGSKSDNNRERDDERGDASNKRFGQSQKIPPIALGQTRCRRPAITKSIAVTPEKLGLLAPPQMTPTKCRGPCPEFSYTLANQSLPASQAVTTYVVNIDQNGGPISLRVDIGNLLTPSELVLNSPQKIQWTLTGAPANLAHLRRVFLLGHPNSSVAGAAATTVVSHAQVKAPTRLDPLRTDFEPFAIELRKKVGAMEASYQGWSHVPPQSRVAVPPFTSLNLEQDRQRDYVMAQLGGKIEHTPAIMRFLQLTRRVKGLLGLGNGIFLNYDRGVLTLGEERFKVPPELNSSFTGLTEYPGHMRFLLVDHSNPSRFVVFDYRKRSWKSVPAGNHVLDGVALDGRDRVFWSAGDAPKRQGPVHLTLLRFHLGLGGGTPFRTDAGIPRTSTYDVQMQFVDDVLVIWKNDHSGAWLLDPGCPSLEKVRAF